MNSVNSVNSVGIFDDYVVMNSIFSEEYRTEECFMSMVPRV